MKSLNKILIASTIAFSSMGANADLIATDWKTTGDSLSTLDEATGIEWLDLTQTMGMSINQVEVLLGSTFSGWRLPTRTEVSEMFYNYSPETSSIADNETYEQTTKSNAKSFESYFGSENISDYNIASLGMYLNTDKDSLGGYSVIYAGVTYGVNSYEVNGGYIMDSRDLSTVTSTKNSYVGVYLVSDGGTTLSSISDPSLNGNNINAPSSVPLPATALLFGLGLTGLMRKKLKVTV
jgi:hypothetical protein